MRLYVSTGTGLVKVSVQPAGVALEDSGATLPAHALVYCRKLSWQVLLVPLIHPSSLSLCLIPLSFNPVLMSELLK